MSKFNTVRTGLLGSAAALALIGAVTAVQAVEAQFGDVSIVFDTTVSVGTSVRVAERDAQFLAESNGGSVVDPRFAAGFGPLPRSSFSGLTSGIVSTASLASPTNREGSVNSDDGRLNYNRGDFFSANVKANHDLQISWKNYKIFARGVEFYDVIQNDEDHTERSGLSDSVRGQVGYEAALLDAFISADYTVSDLPLNIRAGKQVISWGESTFILNGINVINPIDVSAFRRPGVEIKEVLVPVNSIYASIGLLENTSLSAYYMLDFEPYQIDAPGTPFSNVDTLELQNTDPNGNIFGRGFISGGQYAGSFRRNCGVAATVVNGGPAPPLPPAVLFPNLVSANGGASGASQVAAMLGNAANLALGGATNIQSNYEAIVHQHCQVGADVIDYNFAIPKGQNEFYRNTTPGIAGDPGEETFTGRDPERDARDSGQYGLRFNWYAENLGGTEFSFYYQNYHSRLPFVGFRANSPIVSISTVAPTSSGSARAPQTAGCIFNAASNPAVLLAGLAVAPNGYVITGNSSAFYAGGAVEQTLFAATFAADPRNYEGAMAPIAAAVATAAGFAAEGASILAREAASGGISADFDNLSRINCWLSVAQQTAVPGVGLPIAMDGSEFLGALNTADTYFEYPEDIELFGFSFNTVIAGWGVQGEFAYRPNAPFQLDTDQGFIASAFTHCASWTIGSSGQSFQLLQTLKQYNCPYNDDLTQTAAQKAALGIRPGNQDIASNIRNEMFTAQIGTTATFSATDWLVDAVGADLGILVTEVGMVMVPNVEESYINTLASPTLAGPQYQNTGCQASDLPLGGFVDLRAGRSAQCRPTELSAGLVMLYSMQFNNAFDTGFLLSPTLTYTWDFEGVTPAPYGNYLEDRQALGLSLNGTLNNNFRVGASYSSFFGGHVNNKAKDQDFASMTASYTF